MEWSTDLSVGMWWVKSLRSFHDHRVGSIVPAGFSTITRVFYPVHRGDPTDFTWNFVAETTGRIAHPDMQLHAIARPQGERPDPDNYHGWCSWGGDLPKAEMHAVADTLGDLNGADQPVHFGVWEGYGGMEVPSDVRDAVLPIPNRGHFLLKGTLAEVEVAHSMLGNAPNLWWPQDRSWCVASEIDFAWTYVAGDETLAAALEANKALETHRVTYDADHTAHGDHINSG